MRVDFGPWTFDSARCLLARGRAPVRLTRKAFLLLELLLQKRPAVVSKQQILDHLWPDCFVSEGNVSSLVAEIREAAGKDGRSWIRTVHGVGYAFVAETREAAVMGPGAAAATPTNEPWAEVIEKGPPARSLRLVAGTTLFGRGDECDVRVFSATVSRRHARICRREGAATLEDLGSRNGTYRGGQRVTSPVALADGDEIRLGAVELIFRTAATAARTTEAVG